MSVDAESIRELAQHCPEVGSVSDAKQCLVEVGDMAAALVNGIEAVQHILTQLGEYGRPPSFADETNLRDTVLVAFDLARSTAGAERAVLRVNVAEDLSLVTVRAKLTHLLVLLLTNAIEACCQGGQSGVVSVSAELNAAFVDIFVQDTGPGIPLATAEHVFRPNYSTQRPRARFWAPLVCHSCFGSRRRPMHRGL